MITSKNSGVWEQAASKAMDATAASTQDTVIRSIFLSEFHPTAGPKITCQVPENYVSKEIFDAVSVYIIPKAQLQRSLLTVTLANSKILGFPIRIGNRKYARNAFYFNLCFVFDAAARTVQYEPVVKKLSDYFLTLELEKHFLSSPKSQTEFDRFRLTTHLSKVMNDLNTHKICTLTEGATTTHLKVVRISQDPLPVEDHQVPIFIENECSFKADQWDLTTQQVLPYINGFNHVAKIASIADVDTTLVKACVQNLIYYGVVSLIPIFQYANVYEPTSRIHDFAKDKEVQDQCIRFVSKSARKPACLRDIFRLYCSMSRDISVRDLCLRNNPHPLRINERRLVQFGVLHGIIRRIYKYPVYLPELGHNTYQHLNEDENQRRNYSGQLSLDEICCTQNISTNTLEDHLERDPCVTIICR